MSYNILYLTYDGLNDPLGQSQILPYLEGLGEMGYEITVISFEKGEKFKAEGSKLKVIPLKYHKFPPVLSTLYDIYLLKKAVKKVLRTPAYRTGRQQIDIIHCRSYITSLVGLWAKRKYGIKFIFDMRGFWADERVEGGLWNLKNPVFKLVYQYFKKKEKQFLAESDTTVSLTHNAKKEIEQNFLSDRSTDLPINISVIPTCTDLELFNPKTVSIDDSNALRDELGIQKDDFVLLYLGSLGTWYMLDEMLDFYKELKGERLKVKARTKFLLLTKEQGMVRNVIKERELDDNDFIITSSSRQEVPKYISICDASIFFIIPTYSKKASAATKMGEIMAMGKPVITNKGWGDVDKIISSSNGVLVKGFEQDSYIRSILELDDALDADPVDIRETAKQYFSLEIGVEKFHKIYQQLK